jgi:hypothetical protein
MPAYKNRLHRDPDTRVRRHFGLEGLIATFKKKQLRFTRVDKFTDRFEGSVPKQQVDDQQLTFSSYYTARQEMSQDHYDIPDPLSEDPWLRMERRRKAMRRAAHASCWTMDAESEPIWRLYCDDGRKCARSSSCTLEEAHLGVGVALETTLAKLEASVAHHDLFVSPINYRPYHEGPAFTAELDPFMNKREGFSAEKEFRLLKFNEGHYHADFDTNATLPELDPHIYLDWSITDTIEKIIVSPYADIAYEENLREQIVAIDPTLLSRVELSVLHERRYNPYF